MDLSIGYKLMCYKAKEIQKLWNPKEGDFMVAKASYCGSDDEECSEENVCKECLEMSNVFTISGQFTFVEDLGGQHWFFGGSPCARGGGNRMNDTYCFTMTRNGYSGVINKFDVSSQKEKVWLPRQDQIQNMFLSGLTEHSRSRRFIEWLDSATYNPHTYSLEMLWLMFYMEEVHMQKWNSISNIKEWQ